MIRTPIVTIATSMTNRRMGRERDADDRDRDDAWDEAYAEALDAALCERADYARDRAKDGES